MGENSFQRGEIVVGFCGLGVDSGGLESLQILSSSYLWIEFVYARMNIILGNHKKITPGKGEGGSTV